jgi:predicted GIY-YIG superfamily endonuclease
MSGSFPKIKGPVFGEVLLMGRKTVKFNGAGIAKLPRAKPVVYRILTKDGANNYTGTAKRGRVQERIKEHLPGGRDYVPGSRVRIEQASSIEEARRRETRIVARSKPKYNRRGK